ncbi:uncharacterized protein SPAPADRAFT_62469 [Spathaspora passalidarum NRRL Y-27907]|uniref:Uncharacterized protein n=1 Tax=Spathaspora passalidarum (strain NRRL Y-27907 / 11-Y1) TaxID=619300 RepID=G3AS08_SPAPN|nr:uncharacterized protein SPAPADRAFT_62469 [Spathaspora passalidarum NRRL Y-27907]EGW31857.1 hypothetical protein SPAPADRAFT_62469 [Spathaspora passalidarum NRRL Y-27907]
MTTEENKPEQQQQQQPEDPQITKEKLEELRLKIKEGINSAGEHPLITSYVDSTFSYLQNIHDKMTAAPDKKAAAQEIADEITSKVENWMKSRQQASTADSKPIEEKPSEEK